MTVRYITINNKIEENEETKRLIHPLIYKLLTEQTPNTEQVIFYITDTKYSIIKNKEGEEINPIQYSIYDIRTIKYQNFFINGTFSGCSCGLITNEIKNGKKINKNCIKRALNIKEEEINYPKIETHINCLMSEELDNGEFNMEKLYKLFFEGNVKKLILLTEIQFKTFIFHDFFNFEIRKFEKTQFIFEIEHLTTSNFSFIETFLNKNKVMKIDFFQIITKEKKIEDKIIKNIPMLFFVNNNNVITTYKNYLDKFNIKVVDNYTMKEIFKQIFIKEKMKSIKIEIYSTYKEVENENKEIFKKNEYNIKLETNEIYTIFEEKNIINFIDKYFKEKSIYFYLKNITNEKEEVSNELINKFKQLIENNNNNKEELNIYIETYKKWINQLN